MIRGIIFDFDGLILDTESPDYHAWQAVYHDHGAELPFFEWAKCVGTYAEEFDACGILERAIGRPVDRPALAAAVRTHRLEIIAQESALPGVEDYLRDARRLGLKLGLASSSPRAWVQEHLERLGLWETFEVVRCMEDVPVIKPDPALYVAALEGLGLPPAEAFAIEDSPNGILAAKRAGLYCVAVPNVVTREMGPTEADRTLNTLTDLPLEDLLRSLNGTGG